MSGALVLNATYEPLCVVSPRRAAVLVLDEKADVVHDTGAALRSEHREVPIPSVVRLRQFVKVPYQRRSAMSRKAVFARDNHRCQYCDAPADSIDHVIPKSKGGLHTWDNVVAACRPCNLGKRDRYLEDTSMRLRKPPAPPRELSWVMVAMPRVPDLWKPYLRAS
jgi:5-methylcytosine-specific restriction endonuclease McrA